MLKKIVITGATSMIGTALTEIAVMNGTEVYAILRPDTKRRDRLISSKLVHPIYGTLENLNEIETLPNDCDVFYHFAWAGTNRVIRDDPWINEKNIRYTLEAVELAAKCGCHRFVGAGSQAEYGPIDGTIDENTKYNPVLSYGVSKYAAGIMSQKLCDRKSMNHVWGRIFSVYGPHDNKDTMLDYAISCFMNGEVAHFSVSTQFWNYLYETDAGEMFYRLGNDNVPSGTYFVASDESRPLKEYIRILMDVFGSDAKAEFATPNEMVLAGLNVDNVETMKALHYKPQVSFEKGIKKMIVAKTSEIRMGYSAL